MTINTCSGDRSAHATKNLAIVTYDAVTMVLTDVLKVL